MVGLLEYQVRIWDYQTCRRLCVLHGHRAEVSVVAWAPDGSRLASGSYDKTVRMWTADGYPIGTEMKAHKDVVVDLAARMVITRVAVGDGPEDVRKWNSAPDLTGGDAQPSAKLPRHVRLVGKACINCSVGKLDLLRVLGCQRCSRSAHTRKLPPPRWSTPRAGNDETLQGAGGNTCPSRRL